MMRGSSLRKGSGAGQREVVSAPVFYSLYDQVVICGVWIATCFMSFHNDK